MAQAQAEQRGDKAARKGRKGRKGGREKSLTPVQPSIAMAYEDLRASNLPLLVSAELAQELGSLRERLARAIKEVEAEKVKKYQAGAASGRAAPFAGGRRGGGAAPAPQAREGGPAAPTRLTSYDEVVSEYGDSEEYETMVSMSEV